MAAAIMSAAALWETYVQHFDFSQLGWLWEAFNNVAEGDVLGSAEDIKIIIAKWLAHQWADQLTKPFDENMLRNAMAHQLVPMNFAGFIDVLVRYQAFHIQAEEHAGFDRSSLESLLDVYESHLPSSGVDGLKGAGMFSVLDDLGIKFHTKAEREWYVETVKRLDTNGDGAIQFPELCQIIRVVTEQELNKKRLREFDLIKQSGLPFDEVVDWNSVFQQADSGSGALQMVEVKDLIQPTGVVWDREMSNTVLGWINDADEDGNGEIDFGEFCILISKMWASNIHDIRGCCRSASKKELPVSIRSVHGTYLGAREDGTLNATTTDFGGWEETFTMFTKNSGNVMFRGAHMKYINCNAEEVRCKDEQSGTEFKVIQVDDETVNLKASNSHGGILFVKKEGTVALSDGNPEDPPNFPMVIVNHEDLQKRCWTRALPRRKPSKILVEGRQKSKQKAAAGPVEPASPVSPGAKSAIDNLDAVLEENRLNSGRGR